MATTSLYSAIMTQISQQQQSELVDLQSPQNEVDDEKDKKKRSRNPDNWKKEKRKRAILSGREYINTKGELVGPRAIGPDCNCKHKCYLFVSEEHRDAIFKGFYSLKSYDEQNAYLYGLIRRYDIQRKRKPVSERRTCSYKYYVRLKGKEVQVCKKAFANIHGISDKKIRTLCIKHEQNVLFPRDNRGRHNNRPKKVTSEITTLIKHHILKMLSGPNGNTFIKKDKNQGPEVNISQLHIDFLRQYEPDAIDEENSKIRKKYDAKVKSWLYFKVFHEEFNSLDFNAVKRKLSDLRKSLEPASSSKSAKKKSSKQSKPKKKARDSSPSLNIPRSDLSSLHPQVPSTPPSSIASTQMSYVPSQQQQFLSMFNLQHLNSGMHNSSSVFPSASIQQNLQQQQPLNLQSGTSTHLGDQSASSQPLSLNLHPVGNPMSSYYLCFSHVPNLISIPVTGSNQVTNPVPAVQGSNFVNQSNVQQFTTTSFSHPPFMAQTNLSTQQQPNVLQGYSSPHGNLY